MAALGTPGGVVSDEDHRAAIAGTIATQTSTMAVRTGVLVAPGSTALVTGTSATGTMTVAVAPFHVVTTRGTADGVYLGALTAATTVTIAAAPGANSRIDVVYAKQNDSGSTVTPDGSTTFVVDKVTGTTAVSPTKPAIPVGAQELATVTVGVGATSTNGAGVTIANTAPQTVTRGARVPVRNQAEEDAFTKYASLEIYRLDTGQIKVSNGSTFAVTYDPAFPVTSAPRGRVASQSFTTDGPLGVAGVESMFDLVTFTAVAGRRYKLTWDAAWVCYTSEVTAQFTVRHAAGTTITNTSTRAHAKYARTPPGLLGSFMPITLVTEITGLAAGQASVAIGVVRALGTGTIDVPGQAETQRKILVEDMGV